MEIKRLYLAGICRYRRFFMQKKSTVSHDRVLGIFKISRLTSHDVKFYLKWW